MSDLDPWDPQKRCFGFRAFVLVNGAIHLQLMLVALPLIALYYGDLKLPDVLLSDLVEVKKPALPYDVLFLFGYCMFSGLCAWSFSEYANYVYDRDRRAAAACGIVNMLILAGVLPNLYLLLGFRFDEEFVEVSSSHEIGGGVVGTIQKLPWAVFIPWFIHVAGATGVFCSIGLAAAVFMFYIEPAARRGHLEPLIDYERKKFWTRCCVASIPFGAITRIFHLFHDRFLWGYPVLLFEIGILFSATCIFLPGNLHMMMLLDYQRPLISWELLSLLLSDDSVNKNMIDVQEDKKKNDKKEDKMKMK